MMMMLKSPVMRTPQAERLFAMGARHLSAVPTGPLRFPIVPTSDSSLPQTFTPGPLVRFDDAVLAFRDKSMAELLRAKAVYTACKFQPLVDHSESLLKLSNAVLGEKITALLLKATFFGQFCGGESEPAVRPVIARMQSYGVGAILDYAAEADVSQVETPRNLGVDRSQLSARTFDYEGEANCDANLELCLEGIRAASASKGYASVKVTALGKPELLQHASHVLEHMRRAFRALAKDQLPKGANPYTSAKVPVDAFKTMLQRAPLTFDDAEVKQMFERMDVDRDGHIDYLEWMDFIQPQLLAEEPLRDRFASSILAGMPGLHDKDFDPHLNSDDMRRFANMLQRLEKAAETARDCNVTLLVDAEQTYLQPAIDHVVQLAQRKFNKERAVVYNTIQAYRTDSLCRLQLEVQRAQRAGFVYGVKVVRGAYMIQERARAEKFGYKDPIQPTLEATHKNYDECIEYVLERINDCELMVASHNEDSIRRALACMDKHKIPRRSGKVAFGQLLGMCDNVTYSLGAAGFPVFKYVPYGPVQECVPYLIRRAQENAGMVASGADKELLYINAAIRQRVFPGEHRDGSDASAHAFHHSH